MVASMVTHVFLYAKVQKGNENRCGKYNVGVETFKNRCGKCKFHTFFWPFHRDLLLLQENSTFTFRT